MSPARLTPRHLGIGFGIAATIMLGTLTFAAIGDDSASRLPFGPCHDAVAPSDTYQRLALDMIHPKVGTGLTAWDATPERVREAHERYAALRREYLPTVQDACLRAHVADWLTFYDDAADRAAADRLKAPSERSDYEAQRAREQDQVRALAAKLGVGR